MQLNELKRKTAQKAPKRVGRGGSRGKTSGRGTKGQKARAGHRIRPDVREKLKKLPKQRGYQFKSIQAKHLVVNVAALETAFSAGETVTSKLLIERGLIRIRKNASTLPLVKILGTGELTKKVTLVGCEVSESAKTKIEKVGGTVL
ncbi:MAG: 50S ribosomal protein L15 [bacterium]|nr:50S ribosomal protein L15 [bacterium]